MPTASSGPRPGHSLARGLVPPATTAAPLDAFIAGRGPEPTEKQFQAAVVELAERCGWRAHPAFDSRRRAKGYPGLTLIRAGVLLVADLKATGGRTTAAQEKWLKLFAGVPGVRVRRWRPEHWPAICAELTQEGAA